MGVGWAVKGPERQVQARPIGVDLGVPSGVWSARSDGPEPVASLDRTGPPPPYTRSNSAAIKVTTRGGRSGAALPRSPRAGRAQTGRFPVRSDRLESASSRGEQRSA